MAFLTEQVTDLQEKLGLNKANSVERSKEYRDKTNKIVTIMGIITLEDVIEKMINIEILDEDDYERTKTKKKTSYKMSKKIN